MPKVIIKADTFLKKRVLGAADLADAEKIFVPKGSDFTVTEVAPDLNQHVFLKLASPLTAKDGATKLQTVYAYEPHIQIEGNDAPQIIKLNVLYASQLGNEEIVRDGQVWYDWRQCNTTSNTMLANYLLKGELTNKAKELKLSEPESVYMRVVAKYGDTTDHDAQQKRSKN